MTLEACVVRISDIIAYVGRDRQDAIEAGLLSEDAFEDGLGGRYNSWILNAPRSTSSSTVTVRTASR